MAAALFFFFLSFRFLFVVVVVVAVLPFVGPRRKGTKQNANLKCLKAKKEKRKPTQLFVLYSVLGHPFLFFLISVSKAD